VGRAIRAIVALLALAAAFPGRRTLLALGRRATLGLDTRSTRLVGRLVARLALAPGLGAGRAGFVSGLTAPLEDLAGAGRLAALAALLALGRRATLGLDTRPTRLVGRLVARLALAPSLGAGRAGFVSGLTASLEDLAGAGRGFALGAVGIAGLTAGPAGLALPGSGAQRRARRRGVARVLCALTAEEAKGRRQGQHRERRSDSRLLVHSVHPSGLSPLPPKHGNP
jgi:hypothetical protein